MTLSGRMQRKLREVGFVNISGLHPYRACSDSEWIGDLLEETDLGYTCEAVLILQGDQDAVRVCVDALITLEGEVWVAPAGTCQTIAVRSLVGKLAPNGRWDDSLLIDFAVKIDDFFRAIAPRMNWKLTRNCVYR